MDGAANGCVCEKVQLSSLLRFPDKKTYIIVFLDVGKCGEFAEQVMEGAQQVRQGCIFAHCHYAVAPL